MAIDLSSDAVTDVDQNDAGSAAQASALLFSTSRKRPPTVWQACSGPGPPWWSPTSR